MGKWGEGVCKYASVRPSGPVPPYPLLHRASAGLGRTPAPRGLRRGPPPGPGGEDAAQDEKPRGPSRLRGGRQGPHQTPQRQWAPYPPRAGPAIKAAAAAPVSHRDSRAGNRGHGRRGGTGHTRAGHRGSMRGAAPPAIGGTSRAWPPGGAVLAEKSGALHPALSPSL